MKQVSIGLTIISLMALIIGSTTLAGDRPEIDERALDVLTQMGEYLAAADEFSFKAVVTTDEVHVGIYKLHTTEQIEAVVQRPDKLWVDEHGDLFEKRFWYDGKNVTLLSYDEDMYATVESASKTDDMLDDMMEKYGITTPVVDFLVERPHLDLLSAVNAGIYIGLHEVDGVSCHHLAFTQDDLDWQIWIDTGKNIVPLKFVVTYKADPGSSEVVTVFKDWDFSSKHPEELFVFKAPKDSRKIDFLPPPNM